MQTNLAKVTPTRKSVKLWGISKTYQKKKKKRFTYNPLLIRNRSFLEFRIAEAKRFHVTEPINQKRVGFKNYSPSPSSALLLLKRQA